MQAYGDDLAYIHDVGFGDFARNAAPGLLRILKQNGIKQGLVVDLGCGSGIWAHELADAGYDVLGIDISPAMVDLARKRIPDGRFIVGSYLHAAVPPCIAVTALGECFNYLFDEDNGLSPLARLFRRVHDALRPGGLFIFDVAGPGRVAGPTKRHFEGPDWAVLVDVEEDTGARELTRRITSFRSTGTLYQRDHEVHRLRLYTPSEMAGALRRAGFRVRVVRGYGNHRFPRGWRGLIARKR